MERYCETCDDLRSCHVEDREETFPVRGEKTIVLGPVAICDACGHIVSDEQLDGDLLNSAYAAYRRQHGFLTPEEIQSIREQYGLSQVAAAKLLGWSPATFARYEQGALQDPSHEALLRRLQKDASWVRDLAIRNSHQLSALQRRKLDAVLNKTSLPFSEVDSEVDAMEEIIGHLNREGDFIPAKLFSVIYLLTKTIGRLSQSVLLKYLFYIDFLSLKWYNQPLIGLAYVKNHYGPVPARHGLLLDYLEAKEIIHREVIERSGDIIGEYVVGLPVEQAESLNDQELAVVQCVMDTLHGMNAARLSAFSHNEPAWKSTEMLQIISYAKAPTLTIR